MRKATTIVLLLCLTATTKASQEIPNDITAHIKRLAATESKEVRLEAVRKLQHAAKKGGPAGASFPPCFFERPRCRHTSRSRSGCRYDRL